MCNIQIGVYNILWNCPRDDIPQYLNDKELTLAQIMACCYRAPRYTFKTILDKVLWGHVVSPVDSELRFTD